MEWGACAIHNDEQWELFCKNFRSHWNLENGRFFKFATKYYTPLAKAGDKCAEDKKLGHILAKYAMESFGQVKFLL